MLPVLVIVMLYQRFMSTSGAIPIKRSKGKLVFLGTATAYAIYSYYNYVDAKKKESVYEIPAYKLALYRLFPFNASSCVAGAFSSLNIPSALRYPLYTAYATVFGCNVSECAPLNEFPTFNSFFSRTLVPGARPIDKEAALVSPADAKIISLGRLNTANNEDGLYPDQIKGIRYPLRKLLGVRNDIDLSISRKKPLYYCTMYLSPGDYHRFHNPVDGLKVDSHVHIRGEALSVCPWALKLVPGLFTLNERCVIEGSWRHGKVYMVPVGAANVRSIRLNDSIISPNGGKLAKGSELGHFEMGSSVVLVFEAPEDFEWKAQAGDRIKVGESLGNTKSKNSWFSYIF